MAKKQTMNFFEANFEKIIIAVAIAFLGWVVYSNILNAPGVEVSGEKLSATEAAEKGANISRKVVNDLSTPKSLDSLESYESIGDNVMANIEPVEMNEIPLSPPDITKLVLEQDIRNYAMPDQPQLSTPKIMLTHAQANVPVEIDTTDDTDMGGMGIGGRNLSYEVQDVTFVTVEATIDMAALYKEFEEAFSGPKVKKKLDTYNQPIVASVDLVRQELLPDGSWSKAEYVPRMKNDPMKNSFTIEELSRMSKTRHGIAMKDNLDPQVQLNMLQPAPYELIGTPWLNPSAREEADSAENDTPRARGGQQQGMGMGMGMGMGGGMAARNTSELEVDDLKVWAHDETVEPGKIYSYALKVSFFNPCYETNWLVKSDQQWKLSQVFPSTLAIPENPVMTPPQSLFIPRNINDENSARVDIYKFQKGQWFKRSFSVAPGSPIGYTVPQTAYVENSTQRAAGGMGMGMGMGAVAADQSSDDNEIDVEFGVGATVLEIIPATTRWYKDGNTLRSELCGEIVYCDKDGNTKSIASHNAFWSDTFREMYTNVNRAYTADERQRRDQARSRR